MMIAGTPQHKLEDYKLEYLKLSEEIIEELYELTDNVPELVINQAKRVIKKMKELNEEFPLPTTVLTEFASEPSRDTTQEPVAYITYKKQDVFIPLELIGEKLNDIRQGHHQISITRK